MPYTITCTLVLAYIASVIGSYQIVGNTRNDVSTRLIFALLGRNPSRPFSEADFLYFFGAPWIPLLNSYLIYRTIRDNPEIAAQITCMTRSVKQRLAKYI